MKNKKTNIFSDMLKIKNGKDYVKTAKEVAEYHGVHVNAVYQNRKSKRNPDKLDKLMAFDLAVDAVDFIDDSSVTIYGVKDAIINSMDKVLTNGIKYSVVFSEDLDG